MLVFSPDDIDRVLTSLHWLNGEHLLTTQWPGQESWHSKSDSDFFLLSKNFSNTVAHLSPIFLTHQPIFGHFYALVLKKNISGTSFSL